MVDLEQVKRGDSWIVNAVGRTEESDIPASAFFGVWWERVWAIENNFLEFPESLGVFQVNMRELEVVERDRKVMGRGISICLRKLLWQV